MKTFIIVLVIALIILTAYFVFWRDNSDAQGGNEEGVFCTMDAKLCPDGSYVGRVAPSCEFAACPTATSTPEIIDGEVQGDFDVKL